MNIFVAKLNFDTRESDLKEAFEGFGTVDSAKIIMDKFSGKSKGFGFIEMPNDDEAQAAIKALNGKKCGDYTVKVEETRGKGK